MVAKTGAERTKKNYDANREAILAKRRERYHANKLAKVETIFELNLANGELPPNENEEPIIELNLSNGELPPDENKLIEIPLEKSIYEELIEIPLVEEFDLSVLQIITNKINSLDDEIDSTKKIRISNMKSLITIFKPINYKEFIKQLRTRPVNTIKTIKAYQYKPNKTYAQNTLITLFKSILFYFDKFNLKIKQHNKEKYEDQIQLADAISVIELKEKNKSIIPSFEEYLTKVIEFYGMGSREYLIAKLYEQVKCRDNLNLIVADLSIDLDKHTNYLIIGEIYRVVLNNYKTIDRYGIVDCELNTELTNLLEHYMKNQSIEIGDNLFHTNNISKIVSRMNQKMGFVGHGSINLIRKMLASDASVLPIESQLKLAKEMCHSLRVTNSNYVVGK